MPHNPFPIQIETKDIVATSNIGNKEIICWTTQQQYDMNKHRDNYDAARSYIVEVDSFLSLASAHQAEIMKHQRMYS